MELDHGFLQGLDQRRKGDLGSGRFTGTANDVKGKLIELLAAQNE